MLRRVLLRIATAAVLVVGAVIGGATAAGAHASILGTEPGYGVSLVAPPDRVLIRYDLPVELRGAQLSLTRSSRTLPVPRPQFGSADRKDVAVPLPELSPGPYVLTWFLFGSDGDVMGGELAFTVLPAHSGAAGPPAPGPTLDQLPAARATALSFAPLSRAQDIARLAASASLAVLIGGVTFVAGLWWTGALVSRLRIVLWASLAVALLANAAGLGLKGAAVQGRSALAALSPSVLTALEGTHVGNVLLARLGFLILAVPVVALLMIVPEKALSNDLWYVIAAVSGLGALTTHGWLSHASTAGLLAQGAHVVHFAAVSVWLGGLVIVAVVILPRRRAEELGDLVPRFSRLAFGSVVTALLVGGALLILISPRWTALPASDYGRLLLVKILLVAALIAAASRARRSVARHWLIRTAPAGPPRREVAPPMGPPLATEVATLAAADEYSVGEQALRPMVNAVLAELCIAASILAATALLLGRAPPT